MNIKLCISHPNQFQIWSFVPFISLSFIKINVYPQENKTNNQLKNKNA